MKDKTHSKDILILNEKFVTDVKNIIDNGRKKAYEAVEELGIITFWNVGKRIVEEELDGNYRATYGTKLIQKLADQLIPLYGRSYNKRNLDYYRKFYQLFPDIEIVNTRVHNLDWSHVRRVLSVSNPDARLWYLENASTNMWSVRDLDRNISTQYFERRLAAQMPIDSKRILYRTEPLAKIENEGERANHDCGFFC